MPEEVPTHPDAADEAGIHALFAFWRILAFSPMGKVDDRGTEMTLQLASRDELEDCLLIPVDWYVGGVIDGEAVAVG